MKTRLKEIRKKNHLTQGEFGERIGVTQSAVTAWETGNRNPHDTAINTICREFNINEDWLRYGRGDMYNDINKEEQLAYYFGQIMKLNGMDPEEGIAKRVMTGLSRLQPRHWQAILEFCNMIYESEKAVREANGTDTSAGPVSGD